MASCSALKTWVATCPVSIFLFFSKKKGGKENFKQLLAQGAINENKALAWRCGGAWTCCMGGLRVTSWVSWK